jgi:hypothetical protein
MEEAAACGRRRSPCRGPCDPSSVGFADTFSRKGRRGLGAVFIILVKNQNAVFNRLAQGGASE